MKNNSFDLAELIGGLSSVKLGGKAFHGGCRAFKGAVIVGPSCSGKTTLLNIVRESSLCREGKLSVPIRYTTRPKRQNDSPGENSYVSENEFIKMIGASRLGFYWKKRMDASIEAMFGFLSPDSGVLPVYSGNNGLLYNKESVYPKGILDSVLLLGIYAPDKVRKERLFTRSPDLVKDKPEELQYRLMDASQDMLSQVNIVINNYGPYLNNSGRDSLGLLKKIWELF
ncbi:MAG: hypothetical protein ACYDFR_05455 [Candidatus Omnitrophota bacterium]